MSILPKINFINGIKVEEEAEEQRKQGKTFLVDFQKKHMLLKDGKLIKTDDERSVRMWIDKVLLTPKGKYKIYEIEGFQDYGMTYQEELIAQRFPTPLLYSEFTREVRETMLKNRQILEVRNMEVNLINGTLFTSFTVVLKDFKTFKWEGELCS